MPEEWRLIRRQGRPFDGHSAAASQNGARSAADGRPEWNLTRCGTRPAGRVTRSYDPRGSRFGNIARLDGGFTLPRRRCRDYPSGNPGGDIRDDLPSRRGLRNSRRSFRAAAGRPRRGGIRERDIEGRRRVQRGGPAGRRLRQLAGRAAAVRQHQRVRQPAASSWAAWSLTPAASTTSRSTSRPGRACRQPRPPTRARSSVTYLPSTTIGGLRVEHQHVRCKEVRDHRDGRLPDGRRDRGGRQGRTRPRSSRSSTARMPPIA